MPANNIKKKITKHKGLVRFYISKLSSFLDREESINSNMTHEAGLWVAEHYKLSAKASPAESEVTGFWFQAQPVFMCVYSGSMRAV